MKTFKKVAIIFGWIAVIFFFFFGIIGCLQMTKTLWPGLHEDAALYSTVIINRAAGNGNTFDVYTRSLIHAGESLRFKGHGQLYYPIVAAFLASPTYEALLQLLHWSNFIAYILSFIVFLISSRRSLKISWLSSALFGVVGAWSTVAVLQYLQGRPEHGIPFVLLSFALIQLLSSGNRLYNWMQGAQIGIIGAISPLPGLIFALSSVFVKSLENVSNKKFIKSIAIQGFAALFFWILCVTSVYHDSIIELLRNTVKGSEDYENVWFPQQIPLFWLKANFAPALGGVFLMTSLVAISSACVAILKPGQIVPRIFIFICFLLIGKILWRNGIAFSATNYCFMPFLPSASLWLIRSMNSENFAYWSKSAYKNFLPISLFVCLMGPCFGFFRTAVMQPFTLKDGVNLSEATSRIKYIKSTLLPSESILIDGWKNARSAVVFDGVPWSMKAMTDWNLEELMAAEEKLGFKSKYFVSLQFYNPEPPLVEGFTLKENHFINTDTISIFGVQIKGSTQGYGYAIYERNRD
jgi:hypothetical protein